MNNIYERYFVYSPTQQEDILKIESSSSINKYKFGTVVVNGVNKIYTEIVTDMSKAKYKDAVLVTKGDIRRIKFTEPMS